MPWNNPFRFPFTINILVNLFITGYSDGKLSKKLVMDCSFSIYRFLEWHLRAVWKVPMLKTKKSAVKSGLQVFSKRKKRVEIIITRRLAQITATLSIAADFPFECWNKCLINHIEELIEMDICGIHQAASKQTSHSPEPLGRKKNV